MFNANSCRECHQQGGLGGGSKADRNVTILSITATPESASAAPTSRSENLHPAFAKSPSVVLHRQSTSPGYDSWRTERSAQERVRKSADNAYSKIDGRIAIQIEYHQSQSRGFPTPVNLHGVTALVSERNSTAIFGAGELDQVPERVILSAARKRFPAWPEVTGRPVLDENGKVGRFGWKAQSSTLRGFVSGACAVELGLQTPDFNQSLDPANPAAEPRGLDMNEAEVTALTSFVAGLPRPREIVPKDAFTKAIVLQGKQAFLDVGCATCHRPELGKLRGAYTDLLVHEMGTRLVDWGAYYPEPRQKSLPKQAGVPSENQSGASNAKPAEQAEWRTPPLWGLRDSAPYLHDGRAETIDQAIAFHGGEAERSMFAYFALDDSRQSALKTFLSSLAAPKGISDDEEEAAPSELESEGAPR